MVALVIRDREKVRRAIQQLRRQHHFEKEFKSHKTPIGIRLALLKMAVSLGLSFDVMVVDKKQLSAEWQRRTGLELYTAVAGELLLGVAGSLKNTILIVDEIDRHQTTVLKKHVRTTVNPAHPSKENPMRIRKVSGHNSRQDDLLQLADVVVGSVFRARERHDFRCVAVTESRVQWHRFSGEKQNRDR